MGGLNIERTHVTIVAITDTPQIVGDLPSLPVAVCAIVCKDRKTLIERVVQDRIGRALDFCGAACRIAIKVPYIRSARECFVGERCFNRDWKLRLKE